jgi:AcrR family transcriptional regulator
MGSLDKEAMEKAAVVDFRTRTGQVRRARTRARILSTAFALFDRQSVDQVTVEDVRASAGLARGSFYNYFLTYEHMLKELAAEISRQINVEQTANFDAVGNLVERMWCNVRYFILRAASDRSCGEILIRITPLLGPLNSTMRRIAERDIRQCIKRKLISVPSAGVALDLGYGLGSVMIRRALDGGTDLKEINAAGLLLLRAFGVKESEARRISHLPQPALPDVRLREAVISNFDSAKPR